MQLERVVIGMDFSDPAVAAARWTARHFARGAELVLVHAIHIPEPPSFLRARFPPADQLVETARQGADKRLRELSLSLGAKRIRLQVKVGRPAEEVARLAVEFGADLIVVGKHGERPAPWQRLGSTAERVLRFAHVPVLLATGVRDAAPSKFLVPLDDDAATPWVLQWAQFLGPRFAATVRALHVVSYAVLSHVLSVAAITRGAELSTAEVQEEFREETDRWVQRLVKTGFEPERVNCEVAFGDPAQEILVAAERLAPDLIVMGRSGAGRIRRALIGSVAGEVLRHATCPVLVVPEPEDEIVE